MKKTESKKLYRSTTNYVLAGVCGGIAEYFNVDPIIIRLIFILFALANGSGIIIYIIMAIIIPKNKGEFKDKNRKQNAKMFANDLKTGAKSMAHEIKKSGLFKSDRDLIALIIILFGLAAFFEQIFPNHMFKLEIFWPILIVLIGFYLLLKKNN